MAKSIKELENNNFIIRTKSSQDKRQNKMKLTKKYLELISKFKEINNDWWSKMGLNEIDSNFFKTFKINRKSIELNKGIK